MPHSQNILASRPLSPPPGGPPDPGKGPPLPGIQDQLPAGQRGDRRGPPPPFSLEHRLTLFDHRKEPVAGKGTDVENHTLREITLGGVTIGWLGLRKEKGFSQPLEVAFIKRQATALYTIGIIALFMAAAFAWLFSRHLLAPVRQLMDGAGKLTSRNFSARIAVSSGDELGQLAGAFNHMAEQLECYEQLRRQWHSDISHELRTPLAILRGEIEALQDGIRPVDSAALASLHAEALRLAKLVNDLHDLSMAESRMLEIERRPVQPGKVLRAVLAKYRDRLAQRRIAVMDELGDDFPTIRGDEGRLAQLFCNLLENNRRYTESPGFLKVRQEKTNRELALYVEDSGPGVPEEALFRLFDRLYRVDSSRSSAQGGSGLGLAICRQIVRAHNGKIRATKAPMGGLMIEIILPLDEH